ncbi:MAG: tetratricopeptide repeat protein [Meiothermus silvanus]|nr:tetratricopeptide repeat protein [Allomeiothermus silvanus]
MTHKLFLLGAARLETPGGSLLLERKTAAVLAYLALEGPVRKYKLAGWLWPESGETAARNNMRQLLRRLRMAAGEVVLGEDLIELAPEVEADVGRWSYLESPSLSQLRQEEAFLKGSDYDDLPELAEWVESTRAELRELRAQAAEAEATRLERAENFKGALEYAQIRLRMEPLSEDSYRQVARLQYLLGDRAAALATLERGRAMLEQELGAEPLPETLRLLRMIESGAHLPDTPPKPKSPLIPATTLRPPVLAGREREWAMMEEAWEAGKLIFLKGQPGVGKSRLAADFLEHKGSYIRLEARPGDPHVPYSSNFRHLRAILAKYPTEPLPDWVRQALAPWMPELGPSPAPVEPSPLQQARFFEAHREIFSILVRHHEAMLLDDLQFQDASSNQVGAYLMSSVLPLGPSGLRGYIGCYRSGDNSEGMDRFAAQFVETGEGVLIELEPLDPDSVLTLLQGLELPGADRLAAGLSRYTGGNPLFILETLKHLIETDTLERGLPARLAPPGRVAPLIQRRLQRLTPAALNLARAAAVAETEFGLGLAQEVLERSGLELAESHAELEAAQILRGNAFTHDLVFEAVLAGIPIAVKQVLHSRTAKYLEMIGADPALIAQHWLEADERKAVPFLLEAAKAARSTYHLFDAADFYERAAALLERQERPTEAAEALLNVCEFILDFDTGARAERLAQKMLELARDPRSSSRAWLYQATLHLHRGQTPEGERAAQQALENAQRSGDRGLEVDPLNLLGIVWRRQGRFEESRAALEQARELCLETHNETLLAAVLSNLGLALQQLNRYAEAAQRFQEAFALQKDRTTRGRVLNNLAICLGQLGRSREAPETLERAREMLAETEGATGAHLVVLTSLANHHRLLLEYRRSLEYLEQARAMVEGYQHWKLEDLYRNFARTLTELGQFEQAQSYLNRALEEFTEAYQEAGLVWLEQIRLSSWSGRNPQSPLNRARPMLGEAANLSGYRFRLEEARLLPPAQALKAHRQSLVFAQQYGLKGFEIAAHTLAAQALLHLDHPAEALEHTHNALALLETYTPDLYAGEVRLTHYQALQAIGDPQAAAYLTETAAWLREIAQERVPPQYRSSFLEYNPFNRAILQAAAQPR